MPGSHQLPGSQLDEAFEEFVRGRSTHLFRLALALTGWDRAAAEDVLQVALERAYRHRRQLFRHGPAEPYVRRVVVNAAIDWRRTRRRRSEQPLDLAANVAAADRTAQVASRDVLVRALAALGPRQRAVLVMRYWEDVPDAEIAAALGCSAGTVRSQASRALARLRELSGDLSAERSDYLDQGRGPMSDIRQRLRDAITAAVDGAEPAFDVMTAVRRRHRRRLRRLAVAGAAAVVLVTTTAVFVAARHALPRQQAPGVSTTKPGQPRLRLPVPLFPGGGRLLLADAGALRWLYPGGRTIWIPGKFDGARVSAGELLAWKYTQFGASYYTMSLDGTRQRLVLPAGHDERLSVINALLSPDGSELAYIRQDMVSPASVTFTLWVLNLATGQRNDLGAISPLAFAWADNVTILTAAPGSKSLLLLSAATGARTVYLTVTDPALTRAYEHARPGAGPPAYIGSDGMTGSGPSARIAVWLAAARQGANRGPVPDTTMFTRPAEVVLTGTTPLVTYAPNTPQQLSLTWGPDGLVLLQTGAGDLPGSWNAYVATLQSSRPSRPVPYGMSGATFNPAGNVIALQDDTLVTFVPTPRPACQHTATCLAFQPTNLVQSGTVQAWQP